MNGRECRARDQGLSKAEKISDDASLVGAAAFATQQDRRDFVAQAGVVTAERSGSPSTICSAGLVEFGVAECRRVDPQAANPVKRRGVTQPGVLWVGCAQLIMKNSGAPPVAWSTCSTVCAIVVPSGRATVRLDRKGRNDRHRRPRQPARCQSPRRDGSGSTP